MATNQAWHNLEKRATSQLRSRSLLYPAMSSRCQLLRFDSFGVFESWEVLTPDHSTDTPEHRIVVDRVWRRDLDAPSIDSLDESAPDLGEPGFEELIASLLPEVPTIEIQAYSVSHLTVDSVLNSIASICIPMLLPSTSQGQDGIIYEAYFRTGSHEASFRWWCEGPREWRELTSVMMNLARQLKEACTVETRLPLVDGY